MEAEDDRGYGEVMGSRWGFCGEDDRGYSEVMGSRWGFCGGREQMESEMGFFIGEISEGFLVILHQKANPNTF